MSNWARHQNAYYGHDWHRKQQFELYDVLLMHLTARKCDRNHEIRVHEVEIKRCRVVSYSRASQTQSRQILVKDCTYLCGKWQIEPLVGQVISSRNFLNRLRMWGDYVESAVRWLISGFEAGTWPQINWLPKEKANHCDKVKNELFNLLTNVVHYELQLIVRLRI